MYHRYKKFKWTRMGEKVPQSFLSSTQLLSLEATSVNNFCIPFYKYSIYSYLDHKYIHTFILFYLLFNNKWQILA